jgi:hypothetical protein
MLYSTTDGASDPSKATMTIVGDKMKISAQNVNKLAVHASNWIVEKTIKVEM